MKPRQEIDPSSVCAPGSNIRPTTMKESLDNVAANFSNQFNAFGDTTKLSSSGASIRAGLRTRTRDEQHLPRITVKHVSAAIEQMSSSTSPGLDNLHVAFVTNGGDQLREALRLLFDFSLQHGVFPSQFKTAKGNCLYKRGDPTVPTSFWLISITSVVARLLEHVVKPLLVNMIEPHLCSPPTWLSSTSPSVWCVVPAWVTCVFGVVKTRIRPRCVPRSGASVRSRRSQHPHPQIETSWRFTADASMDTLLLVWSSICRLP